MTNPSTAPKCPACGAFAALAIIYGYPSAELLSKARQGLVALDGCVMTVWEVNGKEITLDPDWRCGVCAYSWQDEANVISDKDRRALLSKYSQSRSPRATDA
jgi:hypothetical protein